MTYEIVKKEDVVVREKSKYNTREIVCELKKMNTLKIDVSEVKFVNFHSCVYKMCKSEGLKLHYKLEDKFVYMWL